MEARTHEPTMMAPLARPEHLRVTYDIHVGRKPYVRAVWITVAMPLGMRPDDRLRDFAARAAVAAYKGLSGPEAGAFIRASRGRAAREENEQ
jgi:hypothetical protein